MKLKAFPFFSEDVIDLTSDEDLTVLQIDLPVQLVPLSDGWLLQQYEQRILVRCYKQDSPLLSMLVSRIQTRWMLTKIHGKTISLQYLAPAEVNDLALDIGVAPLISEDLFNKNEIHKDAIDAACQWLKERFIVHTLDTSARQSNAAEVYWLCIKKFSNSGNGKGFQLLGEGWRADVEILHDGFYSIKRITRHLKHDSAFSLLQGEFKFHDISVEKKLASPYNQAMLNNTLRDNGSYLELWNLYNDKEWDIALKKAQSLKALRFTHTEIFQDQRVNRWKIWPISEEIYQTFKINWETLDLPSNTQVDLSSTSPDWTEELSSDETESNNSRGKIVFQTDHLIFTPASNRRELAPNFPENQGGGWLYLSLAGQRTIGKRRLNARMSIDSGTCMPQLKWILEGISVPTERRRKLQDLTPYAKESFKGGTPTEKQRLALDKALNTPDIALIIGPPGTGKTQVIAALQRRLAEVFDGQNFGGEVLISSFQHDAVDNALDRSKVFNLPAVRVGGKKRYSDEENDGFNLWVDEQSSYLKKQINQKFSKEPLLEKIDAFFNILTLLRFSKLSARTYLDQLKQLYKQLEEIEQLSVKIPQRLFDEFAEYINEQQIQIPSSSDPSKNAQTLRLIRGLRVTTVSFADDGKTNANKLYRHLKRQLHSFSQENEALLKHMSRGEKVDTQSLDEVSKLKNQLLEQYLPDYRPPVAKNTVDTKAIALFSKLETTLEKYVRQHKQGIAWALQELADSIEMDRRAALKAIENYAMVIGATCQQSASQKMESVKSINASGMSNIEFDTIIIDEAARANPLDLFIPMSMAKRRIILVGDDRQLPHILEPDIEGELQAEHSLTEQQLTSSFRTSLFERLRLQLENLTDHQRVVMLDTQFRMHPLLGDFVSQQFYEAFGLDKVKTTRPESDFAFTPEFLEALNKKHRIYYENRVCQWINVPSSKGKEQKKGTSRIRKAEAEVIAKEVGQLLQATKGTISIGVITFYSAQRDLILKELSELHIDDKPLVRKTEQGYEIDESVKWIKKTKKDGSEEKEEGLRVGSVDAFQGKEFDIVFLSCVRTLQNHHSASVDDKQHDDEALLNRMFGFLRLPNRMNVAMSRQRQMLISVGDSALATHELSKKGVPALNAFYELCGGNHGYRR